jgi:hypothetical protein
VLRWIHLDVLFGRKRNRGVCFLETNRPPGAAEHAESAAEASIRDDDAGSGVLQRVDSAYVLGDEAASAAFVARVARARRFGTAKACGLNMRGSCAVFATVAESPEDEL